MKKILVFGIPFILLPFLPFIESTNFDVISLRFSFPEPKIEEINGSHRVVIEGLPIGGDLNKPCLPVKPVRVLLPYGRKLKSVEVRVSEKISLGSGYKITFGKKLIPLYKPERGEKMEDSNLWKLYSIVGTYFFRGYPVLFINLYPIQYIDGEIFYYKHFSIEIKTKESSNKRIRGLEKDITKIVDNPSCIASYNFIPKKQSKYEYIIITSEYLANASAKYTFHDLVRWKNEKGVSSRIFTVEEIVNNRNFSVNGTWGDNNPANPFYNSEIKANYSIFDDIPARIRNFIRYAYFELGAEYILLAGDADVAVEEDNIIPARGLYASEVGLPLDGFEEDDIPSDVYYACLDGNFNYDMDERWGENASCNNLTNVDEADLLAEVYVGRACVDSPEEVSNFVMKTILYEKSESPYLSKTLLIGEYLGFPGISVYGGNYKDLIMPLIPKCFNVETLYDRDNEWDSQVLLEKLNNNPPHLINHLGHGFVNYALRLHVSQIKGLKNDRYFFIYSQTCLAGSFDNCYRDNYYEEDCVAEYFTVETPHGAFAVIMNSRFGLGSEDSLTSPSQLFDESFFKALFKENIRKLGRANHYSKEEHIWRINENGIRWVFYETNLFGDPELSIKKPGIEIEDIQGGFWICAKIKNVGNERKNVKWSIELSKGLIIGKREGNIPLSPGEEILIRSGFVVGVGKTIILIRAGDSQKIAKGFILPFFIFIF